MLNVNSCPPYDGHFQVLTHQPATGFYEEKILLISLYVLSTIKTVSERCRHDKGEFIKEVKYRPLYQPCPRYLNTEVCGRMRIGQFHFAAIMAVNTDETQ